MDQDTTKVAAALKAQLNQEPAEVAYAAALRAAISEARGGTPGWAEIDPVQVLKEERTREVESIRSFVADTDRRRKLEALSFQIEDSFGWKNDFQRSHLQDEIRFVASTVERLKEENAPDAEMTATLDRISRLDSLIRLFEEEKPQSKPLIAFR